MLGEETDTFKLVDLGQEVGRTQMLLELLQGWSHDALIAEGCGLLW